MKAVPVLDLACPPRTEMLRLIRQVVLAASNEAGFPPDEVGEIEISVDEACTNVIQHAYTGDETSPTLHLNIRLAPDHVAIHITDTGTGLPSDRPGDELDLEEYVARAEPHGLGLLIIDQFMDEVSYDSAGDRGTILSMVKYLRRAAGQ
jgi:serine/threonine-protein kinase RsbW